jgi:hypothetical protein
MRRRFVTGLATAVALTASLLIAGVNTAAAQDVAPAAAEARGAGAATPNAALPEAIRVDETRFRVVATQFGVGKQVYTCGADGRYTLREPVAVLLDRAGNAGIHGKGPFWASVDGSRVDGSAPVAVPSPAGPQNVAWLRITGTPVPDAPGVFGNVAFIQRVDTRGGAAPASCTAPSTVAVDYSTNYVFWAPK